MNKIWYQNYEPGINHTIDLQQYSSLVDLFEKSCVEAGTNPAFCNFNSYLSYAELDAKSQAFAAYLQQQLGLKKGERVALMLPNVLQFPVALFGILRAGLVVININPLFTPAELIHLLKDSGANTIIILANFAHTLEKALEKCVVKNIIITQLGDLFPGFKKYIVNFIIKHIKKKVPKYHLAQALSFNTALTHGSSLHFEKPQITQQDLAFLQYTGGTTGISKGAQLTHRNILANVLQVKEWSKNNIVKGKEIIITALPMYHIYSLTVNCLLFIALQSLNILITNPRDIAGFIKEIKKFKFSAITGVNTLFNALVNHPDIKDLDFSKTRFALAGGMAVQQSVAEKWQTIAGCPLIEGYGLTEASPVVCANPMNLKAFNNTIGLPIPSTDVSIRDDNNQEITQGESGELCIKGPQVMSAYWQNPEETRKIFTEDGWLKTGDIAVMDEKGFIRIIDRKKDTINVSGFNVFPHEVEEVISNNPGVLEVAVVGVPSEKTGEMVKAIIVKKDVNLSQADIIKYCEQYLTPYKIPKIIEFKDELPKSSVGKILRRELR